MFVALSVDRGIDLSLFTGYLRQTGIRHRISEDGDQQVVRVYDEADIAPVQALYERLSRGEITLERREVPESERPSRAYPGLLQSMWQVPLTTALVLVNVALYPVTRGMDEGHFSTLLHWMTFTRFKVSGEELDLAGLHDTLASGQYWRLLTPMFLHFGIMHITFNLLWVWVVGRGIERVNGALVLGSVVLLTSLASNLTQYWLGGPAMFGGMSGVVFGLLGYSFMWGRLVPSRDTGMPVGVYVFMAIFLVLGFLDVFDFMIPGKLANGAHLGGVMAGLVLGLIYGAVAQRRA